MLTRASILLLLVLNVGVAAWWALRPAAIAPVVAGLDPAIARLQLVDEARAQPRSAAAGRPSPEVVPEAGVQACFEVGPFADDAALAQAQTALPPQVARASTYREPVRGRGWRVWLPPLADRASAQAMAARIVAAGIKDYYVVPDGSEANSIALGRYGNADAAQRRQAELQAAGFPAQAEALGAGARWIRFAAPAAFDIARLQPTLAAQQRPLDCAALH